MEIKGTIFDERLVRLVAAITGSSLVTSRKYLEGRRVKGAFLRDRLAAATRQATEILAQSEAARSSELTLERSATSLPAG